MTDQQSANLPLLVSRELAENTIGEALRLFVGRGRRYSVKQISNATGVKDRAIECALYPHGHVEHRALHAGALLSIAKFLGSDFTNEWLKLSEQGAFNLPDDGPDPGVLAADNSDDSAKVVRMALDNKIDAHEAPDAKTVGARMITHGAQLVSLGVKARRSVA